MKKKYIVSIILVAIVANLIFLCIINKNKSIIFQNKTLIEVDSKKTYKKISVEKLTTEYKNEVYGDKKYKDKVFTVYGKLREVKVGDDCLTVVLYCDEYRFDDIVCYVDNVYKDKFSKYKTDDIIKLSGIIRGKFYDIVIDDCIYISGGNDNE